MARCGAGGITVRMNEYISKELVVETMCNACVDRQNDKTKYLCKEVNAIEKLPTIEIVHCKDCKHRNKEWYQDKRHKDGGYWLVCCENDAIAERIYGLAQDYDFCSYGERR